MSPQAEWTPLTTVQAVHSVNLTSAKPSAVSHLRRLPLFLCLPQAQPVCDFSTSASSVLFDPLNTLFGHSMPRVLFRRSLDYYFGCWGRLINGLAGGWLLWWANVSQILQGGENNSQEYSRHLKQASAIIGPIEILSGLLITWLNYKFWHLNYKKDLTLFKVIFS